MDFYDCAFFENLLFILYTKNVNYNNTYYNHKFKKQKDIYSINHQFSIIDIYIQI